MTRIPILAWTWSRNGRRVLVPIPPGIAVDPVLAADEVEIDTSDLVPLRSRTVTPQIDEAALADLVRKSR